MHGFFLAAVNDRVSVTLDQRLRKASEETKTGWPTLH